LHPRQTETCWKFSGLPGCVLTVGCFSIAHASDAPGVAGPECAPTRQRMAELWCCVPPTPGPKVRKALGRKLSVTLSAILLFYQWGSGIAYIIIVGDTFTLLLAEHLPAGSIWTDRRFVSSVAALLMILPLCYPRCTHST
jgi:hypothetical protein